MVPEPSVKAGQAGKSTGKGLLAPSLGTRLLPGEKKAVSGRTVQTRHICADFFSFSPDFRATSGTATVCQELREFRGRGRNVTSAEARLPCRKHVLPDRHASEPPLGRAARVQSAVGSAGAKSYGISFRKNSSSPGVSGFPGKSRNQSWTLLATKEEALISLLSNYTELAFKPLIPQGVVFWSGPTPFKFIVVLFLHKAALWHKPP